MSNREIARRYLEGSGRSEEPKLQDMYRQVVINEQAGERYTLDDINSLVKSIAGDLSDEQLELLFKKVKNFPTFKPMRDALLRKGWSEIIVDQFAGELQTLLEPLHDRGSTHVEAFVQYLQSDNQIPFTADVNGNLEKIMSKSGLDMNVLKAIINHTGQDEGKRGVGMGELGLSLIFKNVTAAVGKGDLAIDGKEFEIKGEGAALGVRPDQSYMKDYKPNWVELLGLQYDGGPLAPAIAMKFVNSDSAERKRFLGEFKDILANSGGKKAIGMDAVNSRWDKIDWAFAPSIQSNISLMHFVWYATHEQFVHFLAHDYGAAETSAGARAEGRRTLQSGTYVYVSGTPTEMADKLFKSQVSFEVLNGSNIRPRIGFNHTYAPVAAGNKKATASEYGNSRPVLRGPKYSDAPNRFAWGKGPSGLPRKPGQFRPGTGPVTGSVQYAPNTEPES